MHLSAPPRYLLNYMGRDRRYTEEARLPLLLLHRHVSLTFPQPLLQGRTADSAGALAGASGRTFGELQLPSSAQPCVAKLPVVHRRLFLLHGKKGVQPTVQVLRPLRTSSLRLATSLHLPSTCTGYLQQPGPGTQEWIGIHHAGAELQPAKGDTVTVQ